MPWYDYSCACGQTSSQFRPMSEFRARPRCDQCGKTMERNIAAEHVDHFHRAGLWPQHSLAAAVHPMDRVAAMEAATAGGVRTDFDSDGRPVFESPRHKKQYLEKVAKMYDRDGGYTAARRHP